MSTPISLKEAERRAFQLTFNDGLWDIFLGCFFLIFAIGPFLSPSLGDFWGSVIFLPFWGLVYLVIWLVRKHLVAPRLGSVEYGNARKIRLKKFSTVMLVLNIVAIILGIAAFIGFGHVPETLYPILLGVILLLGFSLAAGFLDFTRLYFYGLLTGLAPLVGEWLFVNGKASHHGNPIAFGTASGIMILVGLVVLVRLLNSTPIPTEEIPSREANNGPSRT